MKGKRQSTVEPVFGTLTQFMGLRKINAIGLGQANKVMHLAAIAYNLKKYLKFTQKRAKSGASALALCFFRKWMPQGPFFGTDNYLFQWVWKSACIKKALVEGLISIPYFAI